MAMPGPTIAVNGSSTGYVMYAIARFQWKSEPEAASTCVVNVGGPDGFALSLSRRVVNKGVSFVTCNAASKCDKDYGWLETNGSAGAGYAFRDKATSRLSFGGPAFKGTITYSFRASLSKCTQVFSTYAHSWDKTSVNGFSIGPWSIGVQWSSSSDQWKKSSQAGSYGC